MWGLGFYGLLGLKCRGFDVKGFWGFEDLFRASGSGSRALSPVWLRVYGSSSLRGPD